MTIFRRITTSSEETLQASRYSFTISMVNIRRAKSLSSASSGIRSYEMSYLVHGVNSSLSLSNFISKEQVTHGQLLPKEQLHHGNDVSLMTTILTTSSLGLTVIYKKYPHNMYFLPSLISMQEYHLATP